MAVCCKTRTQEIAIFNALLSKHHLPKLVYGHLKAGLLPCSACHLTNPSADVVAKYIYFEEGKEPTPEDIVKSEILEGRIREGFVRIRQLLVRQPYYSHPHQHYKKLTPLR